MGTTIRWSDLVREADQIRGSARAVCWAIASVYDAPDGAPSVPSVEVSADAPWLADEVRHIGDWSGLHPIAVGKALSSLARVGVVEVERDGSLPIVRVRLIAAGLRAWAAR